MTDLVLVRHGETVWHAENRYAGLTDVELTPRGLAQAAQLAGWAAGAGLEAVWASPLSRARITAETAAKAVSRRGHAAGSPTTDPGSHATEATTAGATGAAVPVRLDERLRELDFGQGDGLTSAEMKARFPEARAAFEADPAANPLPGGEDPHRAADRFVAALGDIAAAHLGGRVLVVAHTTAIRLALCRLIGVPLGEYRRLFPRLDNCALTELRLRDGQVAMLQYNSPIGAVR
ncbi:histidine phosphatase family protein [Nonomuraea gerenzanensis]|uniref:Alpha-ribazole-5'-phosphate phosphatase n=1 Tax=Nonomuraea gerenzanensis TaxID=93944 RepID=A0A1M4ENE4_9ACTN|nr:histidine phosphatase family protein [Nonomuraea gerenzanensis]UBU11843.1 histidine phosphatase family protein [Nonomuraea gerenzanensis]SBP00350.1 Alpha-ribazole-5'-phosphate phosphatase [Nonomuraea gerenzanensis]